jgi:hypothetical protein
MNNLIFVGFLIVCFLFIVSVLLEAKEAMLYSGSAALVLGSGVIATNL